MFNGLWCYRYLLWNLVSRDFKLKYRRSVLGVVWSVLNPLLMCLVYWAVFSSLMDMRGSKPGWFCKGQNENSKRDKRDETIVK